MAPHSNGTAVAARGAATAGSRKALLRPSAIRLGLLAALTLAIACAGHIPGEAAAGVGDYASTLYLSGAPSSVTPSGKKLVTSPGPGQPTVAPTAVATTTVGNLSGSLTYLYTVVDPVGGETTASPASTTVTIASSAPKTVTVGGLPTGVTVNLYRKGTSGIYRLIASLPNNSSATYTDNTTDPSPDTRAILPQTQNKPATITGTGYYKFVPGVPLMTTAQTSTSVASPEYTGEGWTVDASGRVSIPSGTWTFTTTLKGSAGNGVAHLVIGVWKVDGTGAVVGSPIVDPATTGENTNTNANIATTAGTTSAIVADDDQQRARRLARRRRASLRAVLAAADDRNARWQYHDDAFDVRRHDEDHASDRQWIPGYGRPRQRRVAGQCHAHALGNLHRPRRRRYRHVDVPDFCSDSACTSVLQTGTASSIANGARGSWTPTALADGTYFFRAQAQDSAANQSDWSATSTFTVDKVAPSVPVPTSPAAAARVATSQLAATFSDSIPPTPTRGCSPSSSATTRPACTSQRRI